MAMNEILRQIVLVRGGTVTSAGNRNELLKDWLNSF